MTFQSDEVATKTDTYIFREPANADELQALLRVRYAAFMDSDWASTVTANDYGIDIDDYDYYATIVGLFVLENGHQRAVGSIRLVTERKGRYAPWLNEILSRCPQLQRPDARSYIYSMYKSFENSHAELDRFIAQLQANGSPRLCEAGRLALDPSLKNSGIGALFIETMFAIAFINHDVTIMQVNLEIMRFYQSYGFQPMEGVVHHHLSIPFQAHFVSDAMINTKKIANIKKIRQEYIDTQMFSLSF